MITNDTLTFLAKGALNLDRKFPVSFPMSSSLNNQRKEGLSNPEIIYLKKKVTEIWNEIKLKSFCFSLASGSASLALFYKMRFISLSQNPVQYIKILIPSIGFITLTLLFSYRVIQVYTQLKNIDSYVEVSELKQNIIFAMKSHALESETQKLSTVLRSMDPGFSKRVEASFSKEEKNDAVITYLYDLDSAISKAFFDFRGPCPNGADEQSFQNFTELSRDALIKNVNSFFHKCEEVREINKILKSDMIHDIIVAFTHLKTCFLDHTVSVPQNILPHIKTAFLQIPQLNQEYFTQAWDEQLNQLDKYKIHINALGLVAAQITAQAVYEWNNKGTVNLKKPSIHFQNSQVLKKYYQDAYQSLLLFYQLQSLFYVPLKPSSELDLSHLQQIQHIAQLTETNVSSKASTKMLLDIILNLNDDQGSLLKQQQLDFKEKFNSLENKISKETGKATPNRHLND